MQINESKHDILRLMNEYCYAVDNGALDLFAKLFERASFEISGDPGGVLNGSGAVREMLCNVALYDGKPQTKHVMTNVQIDVDDTGIGATAQCYITVFQALPPDFPLQPIFIGHYHDVFAKSADGWHFKSRSISPDLIGDLSYHRADMA